MQSTTPIQETVVIELSERIDTFTAPDIRRGFDSFIEQGTTQFVIDLSAATFLDSAGLAALVQLLKKSRARQGDVKIVLPQDKNVQRIFKLTKFDSIFDIAPTVSEAEKAFERPA